MKYLFFSEDIVCKFLSEPLVSEIERFDIRSEIVHAVSSHRECLMQLKRFKPHILIVIGTSKARLVIKRAKKYGIKTCFFYQSLLDGDRKVKLDTNRTYFDIPHNSELQSSLLSDVVRKSDSSNQEDHSQTVIAISYTFKKSETKANFLIKRLSHELSNVKFRPVELSKGVENAIHVIKGANAMIAMDQLSNMLSVLLNAPAVDVYSKVLFSRFRDKASIVNELLEEDIVGSFSIKKTSAIADEMSRILNDHEHCANIMAAYQELKSMIGTKPFAREAAREIVALLEENY